MNSQNLDTMRKSIVAAVAAEANFIARGKGATRNPAKFFKPGKALRASLD